MFLGSRPEGYETLDLASQGGDHLEKVVRPMVGAGERAMLGMNNGSFLKVVVA